MREVLPTGYVKFVCTEKGCGADRYVHPTKAKRANEVVTTGLESTRWSLDPVRCPKHRPEERT